MKKIFCLLMVMMALFLAGCEKNNEKDPDENVAVTDAVKFKKEYENYNGKQNSSGKDYRNITIADDNPFVYKTAEEIVKMVEDEESFVVYFGFSTCPWCRSVLPTLVDVAKDLEIDKIYYVDVYDIRDTYSLNSDNKAEKTKDGSEGYNKLIELFSNVLDDYTLTTSNGKTVKTGEKRIYAPNIVSVIDGKAKSMTSGISDKQSKKNDAYMELTEDMIKDTYDKLSCVISCVADSMHVCTTGC